MNYLIALTLLHPGTYIARLHTYFYTEHHRHVVGNLLEGSVFAADALTLLNVHSDSRTVYGQDPLNTDTWCLYIRSTDTTHTGLTTTEVRDLLVTTHTED